MVATRGRIDGVNVEDLASSIMAESEVLSPLLTGSQRCIFKMPTVLCSQNEKAYVPDAFSIGPFHHGRPNLKATEKIKFKYSQGLICRSDFPELRLREIVNSVKVMEKEIRECYAEPIGYSPVELVKILVVDGCFIIELFRKNAYKQLREIDDPVFTVSCMFQLLYHDLLLLENQIPWMVLEHLFNMTLDPLDDMPLIQLATKFFRIIFSPTHPPVIHSAGDVRHILDLIRKWLASPAEGKEDSCLEWQPMPSATSLRKDGIKIKKGSSENILDIKFKHGVLEIPPMVIHDLTETVFRNLIGFEQCYPNCDGRFTSYAILMDHLIDKTKDLTILCENDIINNRMSPDDAVQFFHKLPHNAFVKKYYYGSLCKEVNRYYERSWPRWQEILVSTYFNTPWAALSTFAGAILMILSLLQACNSMTT